MDGTTVTLPDTPKNQADYPQQSMQKPGLVFPISHWGGLLCGATGALLDAAIGPYSGKTGIEHVLFRELWAEPPQACGCVSPGAAQPPPVRCRPPAECDNCSTVQQGGDFILPDCKLYGRKFATRREAMDEVLDQVMDQVMDWLTFNNHKRSHSMLGYVSPTTFEQRWFAAQQQGRKPE